MPVVGLTELCSAGCIDEVGMIAAGWLCLKPTRENGDGGDSRAEGWCLEAWTSGAALLLFAGAKTTANLSQMRA